MILKELKNLLRENNVKKGDVLCVSSDITSFGVPKEVKKRVEERGPLFLLDSYIETFKDAVGRKGLLVMPTFSYKETRGEIFNVKKTGTTLGVLPEHFRKQKGVARSLHPIFSFAAWGRDAKKFVYLKDLDCFGKNSIFGKLYDANATYALFGIDMQHSATFIYYSEQKYGVPYRNFENFSEMIALGNKKFTKNVRYFVRNRSIAIDDNFYKLEKKALETGVINLSFFSSGKILTMQSKAIDKLIQGELKKDTYFLIKKSSISL